jgi:hypothetical protein
MGHIAWVDCFQDHECYLDEVFLSTVHIYVAKMGMVVHNRERSTQKEGTFMEIQTFFNLISELEEGLRSEKENANNQGEYEGVQTVLNFLRHPLSVEEFLSTTNRWKDWVIHEEGAWKWAPWRTSDNSWKQLDMIKKQIQR